MKNLFVASILFTGVLLSSAQTNPPAANSGSQAVSVEQKLQNLEREWGNAVVKADVQTIDRIQADDFEFTDFSGQVWTKLRAKEFIAAGRLQIDTFEMSEFKVRIYGDTAIVSFRVMWNGKAGENDISGPQRMTDVFLLRDGNWRCVSSHTSRIP